jgi:hypothetical protein
VFCVRERIRVALCGLPNSALLFRIIKANERTKVVKKRSVWDSLNARDCTGGGYTIGVNNQDSRSEEPEFTASDHKKGPS